MLSVGDCVCWILRCGGEFIEPQSGKGNIRGTEPLDPTWRLLGLGYTCFVLLCLMGQAVGLGNL